MIDLSFLTDEEQEAILKVLQRDANLKRAEEERVRHLPEKVNDENQIKNMSGQWFYEVKSKRHRDKIHGADIIRASMRRKPLTAAELSQNKNGKKQKSWVNNVNKEVFTPPELFGAIEEAEGESKSSLSPTAFNADATPQEGTKKAAASPSKERKNPFNNSNLLEDNADRKHSERGISSSSETSKKDSLLPSVENQPEVNVANGRLEKPELASVEPNDPTSQTGKPPVPKARRNVHKTSDVSVTSEDSFSKAPRRIQPGNGQGTPPRGILKRNSSTSSTDSEILRLNQAGDPSYKNGLPASTILEGVVDKNSYPGRDPEGFSQNSLERAKQVRFSSSVSRKERPPSLELHEGKESGEFGLLDSDCGKTGGDQAHGSDSLRDKQTPLINLFASTSMDLNGCAEDQAVSKEGKADLVSYNANGSGQPSGTVQSQESSPAEHGASSDSSRETFPKVTKEPSSDETKLEIKTGQRSPGPDDKPSSAGQPLPLANTEDPQAPSVVPTDLEQGKPVFVGDPSAKTPSKSDKHAAEASKAADESISKVLDWFKRSSSTESEGTTPSSASQGREPSEEMSVTETRKLAITKEENASSRDVVNLDPSLCDSKVLTGKDLRFHDGGSQPELLSFAQIRSPSRPLLEEQRFSCDGKERDIAEPRDQRSAHFQTTGQETNYAGEANLLEEAGGGSEAEGETAACREPKFSDGVKLGLSANSSGKEREVENRTQADGERSVSSYMKEGSFENQARVLPKEPEGQESGLKGIVQRDASADRRNLLWTQQQEIKQASPTEDQKRIKDIRAFWEREPTSPRFGSQEDLLSQNTSINKRTHGDKSESRKAKPAGESSGYVRGESDSEESKYNWVTFRRVELSDDSEPNDNNMNVSLRRIKPELTDKSQGGSAVTRSSKTLPSNWKGAGFTESPEAGNLQTGNDATFSPKRGGDVHTVALAKDKKSSTLPQKPNFTVHSLKEKVNEESKSEMLNPSQFQSLRSFWGAGVKPQGRINEAKETRIPQGNSMGTYQQPSMEIKGVRVEVGQTSLEEEQKSETNQGFLKATPNQPLLANEVSRKSLRFVRQENSYLVESAVSKPMEKMAPPGKEVEESVEKTVVPSKMQPILFNSDLQKLLMQTSQESLPVDLLSDERAAPKETEGQTHYTDHAIQHRTVSTDIGSNVGLPTSEIAETVHRTVIPPKVDVDSFNAGIERLFREALDARPSSEGSEAVNTSKQSSPSEERSFYNKVMQLSHNACPTDQTKRDVLPQSLEKCVSTSDQNIKFKTEGDAPVETTGVNSALQTAPNHKEYQVYQDDISSQKEDLRIPSPTPILPDARLADLNRAKPPGKEVSDTVTESRVPLKRENHDLNSQLLILLEEASELPSVSCMTESISKAAAGGLPGEGQETSALPSPTTVCLSRQTSSEKTEKRDDIFGRMGEDPNGETAMVLPFVNQKNVRGQSHDRGRGDVTSVGKPAEPQLEEVGERAVKTAKPNALEPSRFKDSLNNLMKEDSQVFLKDIEFPKPVFASLRTSQSVTSVDDKGMPPSQEIHEFVEKATAPSNSMYAEFQTNFQKLLMEDMTFLPSNQERTNGNKVERTANDKSEPNQISGLVGQQEVGLQEVEETVHKRFVPSKRQQNELHSGLQKLLAEFSHMSPAQIEELGEKLKAKIQTGQGVEEAVDLSQGGVEKSVAPAEKTVFDFYSGKLTEENSDASLQLSKDRNLQAPYDSPSRSENRNTLVTMPALIRRSSSDYRSELRIPLKGKASKPDVQVPADGKISVVLAGNVFSQKIEQVSLLSTEAPLPGKEASSPTVAKAVETETGYHTQRDAAVVSSANVTLDGRTEEMDVPLGSRRTSTPRAEQETPPRLSQVELILASCHGKSEEDEGAGNFGSDLSNESINSFAEIKRNSTCSAEDPNPVLEALKRSSNRQIPSKSLEDIPSATSNEGKVNARKEDLMLSAEDDQKAIQLHEPHTTTPGISAAPSFPVNQFSNPEKVKRMSKSVPTFLQEESDDRETDTASESSYSLGKIKKSPSSLTNLSGSSGLASLSSVSTSVMSVYSGDFGNVDVKGNIQFAIDYVEQLKELHIFIAQCKDLAVADVKKQRSDPYVKCYLLPEKYKLGKRKTSVKKKTLNPVYNEILRYKVDKILLTSQRLNISVWHNDTFGRNSFLGEVDLDLGSWDWDDRQIKQMIWYPLKPRAPLASLELENRGEIKLSLKYIPQPVGGKKPSATGEVHIWVKECNDLPLLKGNKLNSFVKCTVLPDTSRKSRQKTRAVAKATNPVFNHTMVYDGFKFEDLKEACVELTVWDHKQLVNHFLGGLRIGLGTGKSYGTAVDWMDSTLEETSLWERMMNSPDQWVEGTLPLRMLTIAKLTK